VRGRLLPWPRRCLGGDVVGRRLYDRMVRAVRGYVAGSAYVDTLLGESVCVVNEHRLAGFLRWRFGVVDWRIVELFTKGEVLSNPRGEGSLQVVEEE